MLQLNLHMTKTELRVAVLFHSMCKADVTPMVIIYADL